MAHLNVAAVDLVGVSNVREGVESKEEAEDLLVGRPYGT